jgi:hypothetical protein
MPGRSDIQRPYRNSEYRIRPVSRDAEKGWRDLVATSRNAAVATWEFLTTTPTEQSDDCYRLRDALATVTIDGVAYDRWQYKPTAGGRIWYAVTPPNNKAKELGQVLLERVMTGHPNETLKNHR